MHNREQRLVFASWLVLGLMFGGLASIAVRVGPEGFRAQRSATRDPPRSSVFPEPRAFDPLRDCRLAFSIAKDLDSWKAAQAACQLAASTAESAHAPIARRMLDRISLELRCADALAAGRALENAGHADQVLEALADVEPQCRAGRDLQDLYVRAINEASAHEAEECTQRAQKKEWGVALPRCQHAMATLCWTLNDDELQPTPAEKVSLWGSQPPETWRPTHPVHLALLRSRDRLRHKAPAWECPERPRVLSGYRPLELANLPVRKAFGERSGERAVGVALELYVAGRLVEAADALHSAIADRNLWPPRTEVAQLSHAIDEARRLYKEGLERITDNDLPGAGASFHQALEFDEQVVLEPGQRRLSQDDREEALEDVTSFLRQSIVESMTRRALERGNELEQLADAIGDGPDPAACKMWKLGLSFDPNHGELAAASTNCP